MAEQASAGPEKLPPEKEAVQGLFGNRTQFYNQKTGTWVKRDKETGRIMEAKDEAWEAVPQES